MQQFGDSLLFSLLQGLTEYVQALLPRLGADLGVGRLASGEIHHAGQWMYPTSAVWSGSFIHSLTS